MLLSFERPTARPAFLLAALLWAPYGTEPIPPAGVLQEDLENCTVGRSVKSRLHALRAPGFDKSPVLNGYHPTTYAPHICLSVAVRRELLITVKIVRAHGGCLGIRSRRRAWTTAISNGEVLNSL